MSTVSRSYPARTFLFPIDVGLNITCTPGIFVAIYTYGHWCSESFPSASRLVEGGQVIEGRSKAGFVSYVPDSFHVFTQRNVMGWVVVQNHHACLDREGALLSIAGNGIARQGFGCSLFIFSFRFLNRISHRSSAAPDRSKSCRENCSACIKPSKNMGNWMGLSEYVPI